MTDVGLLLPEGTVGNYTAIDALELAQVAEEHGFHSVWRGESYSANAFVNLAAAACHTEEIRLGTAITNVFSRPPALIAMSVATLDALSAGRTLLGLGVSTPTLTEQWYGVEYSRPLRRTREVIEILNELFETGAVDYDGELLDIGPYPAGFTLDRETVPIFNAALGETNCRLTGEYADGWLPIFMPPDEIRRRFDEHVARGATATGRNPDEVTVAPIVITAVASDQNEARTKARKALAQVMRVGYNRVVGQFGFQEPADEAAQQWREGNREAAARAITDEMVEKFTLHGTPEQCRSQLEAYERQTGADVVITLPSFSSPPSEIESLIASLDPAFRA